MRSWHTVEPLYSGHHWEPTFCPLERDVPITHGLFQLAWYCVIRLNVATFQNFPLLCAGGNQRVVLRVTALVSCQVEQWWWTILRKGQWVCTKFRSLNTILCTIWTPKIVCLQSSGMLFGGCKCWSELKGSREFQNCSLYCRRCLLFRGSIKWDSTVYSTIDWCLERPNVKLYIQSGSGVASTLPMLGHSMGTQKHLGGGRRGYTHLEFHSLPGRVLRPNGSAV